MKPHAIVFTEHGTLTLDSLIKKAAEKGQTIKRGSDFLKFNAHETHGIPVPKATKSKIWGGMTEKPETVPTMIERYNLNDYLPEGM